MKLHLYDLAFSTIIERDFIIRQYEELTKQRDLFSDKGNNSVEHQKFAVFCFVLFWFHD
jgi:hypothetical protein